MRSCLPIPVFCVVILASACTAYAQIGSASPNDRGSIDDRLMQVLQSHGFTGKMEDRLKSQMGRSVNPQMSDLGRNLFFDKILSLKGDNACAGCHAPSAGFSDTQPIAIGIDNNNIVDEKRKGPRNQRRTPPLSILHFFLI